MTSTLLAAPASARGGPYGGIGTYNLDGDFQSIGLRTLAGRAKKAFVKYRNADAVPHRVRIAASLAASRRAATR